MYYTEDGDEKMAYTGEDEIVPDILLEQKDFEELNNKDIAELEEIANEAEAEIRYEDDNAGTIDSVRQYLKDISTYQLLTPEEEQLYARKYRETGDSYAREKLINGSLRLVVNIAKRYMRKGNEFLDLIQEGNKGLIKAVRMYNPDKGYRFSTYSTWWIRQSIVRSIADNGRLIRVPVHMVDQITRYKAKQKDFIMKEGRQPRTDEMAKMLDIPISKVNMIENISIQPTSLDTRIGEDDDSCLMDYIPDNEKSRNPEFVVMKDELTRDINTLLAEMDDRTRLVMEYRYGLNGKPEKTLEEVGEIFKVTRERIRQIEKKGLMKMQTSRARRLLMPYLEGIG